MPSRAATGCLGKPLPLLTALLALSSLMPGSNALFGFGDKRFKYEGLINAGGLGLENIPGEMVAWGDWNGDQFLDAILLDPSRTTLSIHQWNHNSFLFQRDPSASVTIPNGYRVSNVIAADLNYDGRLDILVMSQSDSSSQELSMSVYLGLIDASSFQKDPIGVPSSTLAQPISIDASGDMQMDLLGHPIDSQASGTSAIKLWRNFLAESSRTSTDAFEVVDAPLLLEDSSNVPSCSLANPHSSAYIDLNGDCLADIFLECSSSNGDLTYQIWTAVKPKSSDPQSSGGFALAASGSLPSGTGALSFADMDRDGTIDVVFPSCDRDGGNCFINIAYNRQVPLCSTKSEGLFGDGVKSASSDEKGGEASLQKRADLRCRDPQELCTADDKFHFDFSTNGNNPDLLRIPIERLTGDSRILLTDKLAPPTSTLPRSLQLGDFNKDGHPDIAVITIPAQKGGGGSNDRSGLEETRIHLLENVACSSLTVTDKADVGCTQEREHEGTFQKVREGAGTLEIIKDVRSVSWIDVDEDGTLDLMLQRTPSTADGKDGSRRITFIQNNYFYDAFFLKSLTLNGACQSFCEPEGAPKFRPWGTNYGGASYKFTVLDTNGVRRAQQVGQMPQTGYRSLLTPYSYFGLGRTNNYVESLFIGSTRRQTEHSLALEGIIPNSQVVINPWQGTDGKGDPGMWTKQLYLHPGDWIPWVTIVLITTILGLAAVVVVLHINERREDERERKRAVHAINFDAL